MRLVTFIILLLPSLSLAQKPVTLNIADLQRDGKLLIKGRTVSIEEREGRRFLKFVGNGLGGGVIWLPVEQFGNGKIELVARGMNVLQGSFVGVAFHSLNDSTYDYLYCRPFNFESTDSSRRIHMIQYVYPPKYERQFLRTNYNGLYEKGIANPPKVNDWFKTSWLC